VFKHALLLPLVRGLQRKEKGFLFLDTHAGLGAYDLSASPPGRTLEYVDGIARLWERPDLSPTLRDYVELVRGFNIERGLPGIETLRYYPGSPRIASKLLRPQDRLALTELHPDDFETLREEFARDRRVSVQRIDAYSALRAYLPPPERRALVLIDPPFEDPNEVVRIHAALSETLVQFPPATYVIWYPIKDRSGANAFMALLHTLPLPPTLAVELMVHAHDPADRLNGCGLIVLNPPWQIADELAAIAQELRGLLAREPGATAGLEWLRDED
jgi:23S rRNA (adenine2030-N6)-methyltransferase